MVYSSPLNTQDPLTLSGSSLRASSPTPEPDLQHDPPGTKQQSCSVFQCVLLFVRFINLFSCLSHTHRDTHTEGSHQDSHKRTEDGEVTHNLARLGEPCLQRCLQPTTTADSLTGKHERQSKCVTQFSASLLSCVADLLFRVKPVIQEIGRRARGGQEAVKTRLNRLTGIFIDFFIAVSLVKAQADTLHRNMYTSTAAYKLFPSSRLCSESALMLCVFWGFVLACEVFVLLCLPLKSEKKSCESLSFWLLMDSHVTNTFSIKSFNLSQRLL